MTTHSIDPRRVRLRLEGREELFPLQVGENTVGSASTLDIVLKARGVSRDHAVIVVADGVVTVRDLGSKNGTLVNGSAVSTSPLQVGDEIQFGGLPLVLRTVDRSDAELAITLPRPSLSVPAGSVGGATSLLPDRHAANAEQQLELIARFFAALSDVEGPRFEEALRALADTLAVPGSYLLRGRTGHEPSLVAAVGEIADAAAEVASSWPPPGAEPAGHVVALETCSGVITTFESPALGLFVCHPRRDTLDRAPLLATLLPMVSCFLAGDRATTRRQERDEFTLPDGIVASVSPTMQALYEQVSLLRQGDAPVLILGESGAGKEHVARLVHETSARKEGPFVAINCAAIPQELLEAEMFGIGRGVATGVVHRRGKLQIADGGTLFLDEIGDMAPVLQAKLLRAIQEQEIVPLGCEPIRIDVRLVAATNADLENKMADGAFRRDLYYRLAGYVLEVPPLRARREDLPALLGHFVRRYGHETGKAIRGVSVKALERLAAYPWPGNIRELDNLVRRVVYACPDGQAIESTHLPAELDRSALPEVIAEIGTMTLPDHLETEERRWIRQALVASHGNQTRAAKLLGVSRNGLAYRLKRLGMVAES